MNTTGKLQNKRAEITTPQFVGIPSNTVAICRNVNVVYQGIEDI